MLDYFASRENFLEVGEQYCNHMNKNTKEWQKFINFYSDTNNARKDKDEAYNRDQYVGEELDWKMLADNLTLFGSQINDLKDLRGFDDNMDASMVMNESMMVQNPAQLGPGDDNQPFAADNISMVGQRQHHGSFHQP